MGLHLKENRIISYVFPMQSRSLQNGQLRTKEIKKKFVAGQGRRGWVNAKAGRPLKGIPWRGMLGKKQIPIQGNLESIM